MEMTKNQARLLFEMVPYARRNDWRLPTARELAVMIHGQKEGEKKVRTISATRQRIIKRLNQNVQSFELRGRDWYINPDVICTELKSSLYCLRFAETSDQSLDGWVGLEEFHASLKLRYPEIFKGELLKSIFQNAHANQYIVADPMGSGYRAGGDLRYLEPYFRLQAALLPPKKKSK